MKISDFLILHLFILLFFINISNSLIGSWTLAIYFLVILVTWLFMKLLTDNINSKQGQDEIPNLWRTKIDRLCLSWLIESKHLDQSDNIPDEMTICLKCNEQSCNIHDPELTIYQQPWKHLLIDKSVNQKLEELFEFLLQKYTSPWLENISCNKNLILFKFKELIRLITAALVLRSKRRIKLNEFIMNNIPGHLFQHLEMYVHGKRKAKSAHFLEESVLKHYENMVHPAVLSPDNELKYLKSIADIIIYSTLPSKYIKCDVAKSFLNEFIACCVISPLVEILADPDKINIILIYLLDKNSTDVVQDSLQTSTLKNDKVYFLQGFSFEHSSVDYGGNHFGIKLKQILNDEHLLFLFTRFAKEELFLNHLQFVIHLDSFLNRIINPDLSIEQLNNLHDNLRNIYELYFCKVSKDFIEFDQTICDDFQKVIQGNHEDLKQFRNCKSLYESYEQVNEALEYYAQKFFQTDVYLKLICGQRSIRKDSRTVSDSRSDEDDIREVNNYPIIHHYDKLEINEDFVDDEPLSDMTNWKVSIPHISSRLDHDSNKENFYFEIHVHKSADEGLIIERHFNEFYTVESKLKEFHGDEMDNITLPARKSFVRITKQLMESHRLEFEEFLQQLMANASMRRSRLFHNFLNPAIECFTENFTFSRIFRNAVPSRFSKEKGQHLYSFLKNFIAFCEKDSSIGGSSQSLNKESTKISSINKRRKSSVIHWPELDLKITYFTQKKNCLNQNVSFQYLYDYVLAILIRFYKLNNRIKQFFFLIRPLFRQTFQGFCDYLLCRKLKQTFTPSTIVEMIDYLKESLNHDSDKVKTFPMNLTKNQRSELALNLFKELIPKWILEMFVDYNKHEEIAFLIFSLLQYRLLNKQLLYLLLDLLVAELYPKVLLDTIDQLHIQQ